MYFDQIVMYINYVVLVSGFGQSKAVQDSHSESFIPLFHAVLAVTEKRFYIQSTAIYSKLLAFFDTVRYIGDAKRWVCF